ncbi:MAG: acetoacetate decarboxylase family protein [Candidatus Thorarchaeota archaeon]
MGLKRSNDEYSKRVKQYEKGYELAETKIVTVMFITTRDAVERVLPPPLEPGDTLGASAYVAEFNRPNFCPPYNEAAVFVPCKYEGEAGSYCLAMPVDNDIAMIGGREIYGYPKKIADSISVTRKDNDVHGVCIRRGIPIVEIKGTLTAVLEETVETGPHFLVKSILDEKGVGARANPILMRQKNVVELGKIEIGEGSLTFGESKYDPLHEIPVEEVMMVSYSENATITMPPGNAIKEIDAEEYTPYQIIKYDWDA